MSTISQKLKFEAGIVIDANIPGFIVTTTPAPTTTVAPTTPAPTTTAAPTTAAPTTTVD